MARDVEVLRDLSEQADPRHTAFLVVDVTNDFCHPEGRAVRGGRRSLEPVERILPPIRAVAAAARRVGVPVVYVLHTTLPDGLSHSGPWLAARERAPHSDVTVGLDGTWGQRVLDAVAPQPGDLEVHKFRYSAFTGTRLDAMLRARGVKTVLVSGASTNVCVYATASAALELEYYPVIVEDAVASWNMDLHEAALRTFRARYGLTCRSSDLLALWRAADGGTDAPQAPSGTVGSR
jgi:ureidoacrylate peracid hydrolase